MHLKVIDDANIKTFNSDFKKGNWIILYYADWCGHCQNLKPTWNEYVKRNVGNKSLNIAEIPDTSFGQLDNQPMTTGFPSIKMFNNQKEVADFSGERNLENLEKFSNGNIKNILSRVKKNSSLNNPRKRGSRNKSVKSRNKTRKGSRKGPRKNLRKGPRKQKNSVKSRNRGSV